MSTRIEHLERRVERLDTELNAVRLELRALRQPAPTPPPFAPPPPTPPTPLRSFTGPTPVKEQSDAARWVGEAAAPPAPARVMAWVGGSALLVALILFLALAISRGWIGEEARTAMAALASLLLTVGGARAYERRGRTEAAVAATAAGVAGGFATIAVATEAYALVPPAVGLVLGLAWGARTATALALRWRSKTLAVLGIGGGLLSPVLAGADVEAGQTIALLAIGYAGAALVTVLLGWNWLALLAFVIVLPQWGWYAVGSGTLPFVLVFGAVGAFAAAAMRGTGAHLLLALNAAAVAALGWGILWEPATEPADGRLWLAGLAAAHAAGGLAALRGGRRALGVTALGIGIALADIVFAEVANGLVLPLAWAASAAVFALLTRYEAVAALGLGGHLALAIGHVLTQEAPFAHLGGGGSAAGVAAATAIAAACLVSARLADPRGRRLLDLLGLLAVAYTTTLALEGAPLVAALAAEAAALGLLARATERQPDAGGAALGLLARATERQPGAGGAAERQPGAGGAALAFLVYAAAHAVVLAPPLALQVGLADAGAAIVALLAMAAAAPAVDRGERGYAAAALTLLYLASTLAVTWIDGQPGQLTLSALWGAAGLAALLTGILRDHAHLRTGGLSLLAVASAKVFVVDLASLDSLTRVGSFLAIGTLLLAGAFAWQRARPS